MRVLMANGELSPHPGAILLDESGRVLPVRNAMMNPYGFGTVAIAEGEDGFIETKITSAVRYVVVRDVLHRPVILPVPDEGEVLNVQLTDPVAIARLRVPPDARIEVGDCFPVGTPPGAHPSTEILMPHWGGLLPLDTMDHPGPSDALVIALSSAIGRPDDAELPVLPLASIERGIKYVVDAEWLDGNFITAVFPKERILLAVTYEPEQPNLNLAPDPNALIDLAPFQWGGTLWGQDLQLHGWGSLLVDDWGAPLDAVDIHRCQAVVTIGPKQGLQVAGPSESWPDGPDLLSTTTCLGLASSIQADDLYVQDSQTQAFQVLDSQGNRVFEEIAVRVGHEPSCGFPLAPLGEGSYAFESACGADHVVEVSVATSLERFVLPAGTTDAIFRMPAIGTLQIEPGPTSQALGSDVWVQSVETGRLIDLARFQTKDLPVGSYLLMPHSFDHFPVPIPMWEPRTIEIKAGETTAVKW